MRSFFSFFFLVLQIDAQLSQSFIHLNKALECAPWLSTSPLTQRTDTGIHHCTHSFLTSGDGALHEASRACNQISTVSARLPLCGTSHTVSLGLHLKTDSSKTDLSGSLWGLWRCNFVAKFWAHFYKPRRAFPKARRGVWARVMDGETRLAGMGRELPMRFQGSGPLDTLGGSYKDRGLPVTLQWKRLPLQSEGSRLDSGKNFPSAKGRSGKG